MNKLIATLLLSLNFSILAACRAENSATQQADAAVLTAKTPAVLSYDDKPPIPFHYDAGAIAEAFATHRNLPQVTGFGTVERVLKDDTSGLKHQKFLLKISPTITILIAHNIDLAPRIEQLYEGDYVEFKGEYIYTPKGGTVHWTHKDPRGHHQNGWLKHASQTYE